MFSAFDMREYVFSEEENAAVQELRNNVYAQWSWNYGASPACNLRKIRRVEGCGKIEILLDVGTGRIIKNVAFYGDFFGNADPEELEHMLTGRHLEYHEPKSLLGDIAVSRCFHNLDMETFLAILLE
jgi:lipoate-protein ligase A